MLPFIGSLPQELIDLVLDCIAHTPDSSERRQALASTALVSQRFLSQAHKHLFSTVDLYDSTEKRSSRIQVLHEIIEADSRLASRSIASHIRTLRLHFFRIEFIQSYALLMILKKIFKTKFPRYTFSILLGINDRRALLSWGDMSDDFRTTLYDLCHNPFLTSLSLEGIGDLPYDFLHHTLIRDLSIARVTYRYPDANKSGSESLAVSRNLGNAAGNVPLKLLETDQNTANSYVPHLLRSIQAVKTKIWLASDVETTIALLKDADLIKNLKITMIIRHEDLGRLTWNYRNLSQLVHLHLKDCVGYCSSPSHRNGDFPVLRHILRDESHLHLPQSLKQITIELIISPYVRTTQAKNIDEVFGQYAFSQVDNALSDLRFQHVTCITLRMSILIHKRILNSFGEKSFLEEATSYFRRKFPALLDKQSERSKLCVAIAIKK